MKTVVKYTVIIVLAFAFSCGPKKGIVTKKERNKENTEIKDNTKETKTDTEKEVVKVTKPLSNVDVYINRFSPIARAKMQTSKIPASITLAQGILESGVGKGRLAVEANNHFGIKCHGWKGAKIYHDDDSSQECFRKYEKPESSYDDHSEFLTGRKRYANLFKLKPDDYKGWAKGLKAAGYATDRKYPQKLISLIERYELYKYDKEVLGNNSVEIIPVNSGVLRYVIVKGDTLYSLAKRFNTSVGAIKDLNNMTSNDLNLGQQIMIPN
ncbi:glucosaminidase domain-containing protein [Winogradskyella sp. UBA3174]|jgi:flagellum-specific peptidoglycan hydrolase FlgJ|uniref:glucosaminidase domain-containing protein n=1 Tax=Winogradskyella sp. UBA3174 TaxID=1947785 RepID=UPI0025FD35F1|nr:glucosaminidase domain-containing protein [Winogradskyella sp. UBA3174]|tara:strand:+ start:6435 stop:7238 length:804 start_codon:yes stop_codon:yes gene_type:complete